MLRRLVGAREKVYRIGDFTIISLFRPSALLYNVIIKSKMLCKLHKWGEKMTERLDEHKMKYAVDTDKEAEDICRWAAARAGVIVVAPVVGTMTLMANEVYMITRLAKLRGIKLSESAVLGLLGSLGGAFVGQTLATLIPFAPVQIPVGMSVTYAVGKVANAWLAAGCPEDLSAFKSTYEEARIEGIKMLGELKNMACKDKPLGDESRRFEVDDDSPANKKVDDLLRKVKGVLKKD